MVIVQILINKTFWPQYYTMYMLNPYQMNEIWIGYLLLKLTKTRIVEKKPFIPTLGLEEIFDLSNYLKTLTSVEEAN